MSTPQLQERGEFQVTALESLYIASLAYHNYPAVSVIIMSPKRQFIPFNSYSWLEFERAFRFRFSFLRNMFDSYIYTILCPFSHIL